jgi:cytochrome c-type biogenesis protein CcmH/NrfF
MRGTESERIWKDLLDRHSQALAAQQSEHHKLCIEVRCMAVTVQGLEDAVRTMRDELRADRESMLELTTSDAQLKGAIDTLQRARRSMQPRPQPVIGRLWHWLALSALTVLLGMGAWIARSCGAEFPIK